MKYRYLFELTTFQILGQKFIKFSVGFFGKSKTLKSNYEINCPLKSHYITQTFGIDVGQLRLIFWLTSFILLQKNPVQNQHECLFPLKSDYITQTFGAGVGQLRLKFWLTFFILLQKNPVQNKHKHLFHILQFLIKIPYQHNLNALMKHLNI